MSQVEMHEDSENTSLSASDLIICMLGALASALVAWAIVFGLFAGVNFGLVQLNVTLPDLAASALATATNIVPLLAALVGAFLGYRFLARLP